MAKRKGKDERTAVETARGPVLAAIDFSAYSVGVVRWAAEAATAFGVGLRILHVVHDPESAPGYYTKSKKHRRHVERVEEAARSMMEDFLDQARAMVPGLEALRPEAELVVGLPVTRVLEVAEAIDACLIVVGSRGRSGLSHLLLGSKAERIVQLSPTPVTVVKRRA